jgi:F-type H+-transporting ATPase subunit gamma
MAISPRLIRRRISSVQNTRKITRAMEMVSAAKMRRAVAAALQSRAYANLGWNMVSALRESVDEASHPLLRRRSGETGERAHGPGVRMMYVVMASDRGLCGGFNASLFRELQRDVKKYEDCELEFVTVGKKAEQFVRRMQWNLVASVTDISTAPTIEKLRPVATIAIDAFSSQRVGRIRIAFTDFISSLRQQPRVRTLLPIERFEELGPRRAVPDDQQQEIQAITEFLFEPSPKFVLDAMLPRLVELQIYQAYLDTGASEHSARMMAMQSASDAALEMIDDLTLRFNQARQSMITQEIAEISAGRAALAT